MFYYERQHKKYCMVLTNIQRSTASRAILPFVKQWIVFNTCNINNYSVELFYLKYSVLMNLINTLFFINQRFLRF
jgi:hypothetical protein